MSNVAIVGAGPAGLFAAEHLARAEMRVDIYDHKPSPARKFLMAGRGGLNITHSEPLPDFIARYGEAADFLRPAITGFTPQDMHDWCASLGEDTFIGTSGRVFPKSFKASPLLRAWLARLNDLGVTFHFHHRWVDWHDHGAVFETPDGPHAVKYDALLLALGGASWPRLGSDAAWVPWMRARNIEVTAFAPANCGFHVAWSDVFRTKFAGKPLKSITLTFGDRTIPGEIMITEKGVEGGGIYALSSQLRRAVADSAPATLHIDLKPDYTQDKLTHLLNAPLRGSSFANHLRKLTGLSPVAIGLLQEDRQIRTQTAADIAHRIKHFPLTLTAPFDLSRAISSAGGIAWREVNADYMLKKCEGVFVAGEMLDWEAPTGGYLLQASFATAKAAAEGIVKFLSDK